MNDHEEYAPIWAHLEELRGALLKVLIIILASTSLSFFFYNPIITFLIKPLEKGSSDSSLIYEHFESVPTVNPTSISQPLIPRKGTFAWDPLAIHKAIQFEPKQELVKKKSEHSLVILNPLEGLLTAFKISLWMGSVASSPFWLMILMRFLMPGLRQNEQKFIFPFLITSYLFIFCGFIFAYTLTIPIANHYFSNFNQAIGINQWSLGAYLDYSLFLFLANGLAFELVVIGIFAVNLKLVTHQTLISKRSFAIVIAFILAAFLTPPDILTQVMMAIPLVILYELLILYARLITYKSKISIIK